MELSDTEDKKGGTCGRRGEEECMKGFVGNPEGKCSLRKPQHKWENNVRMYLKVEGWESMEWIRVDQGGENRLCVARTVINLRVP